MSLCSADALLTHLWQETAVIELDEEMMLQAADLSLRHQLRGYDAMHCAAAIAINDVDLVAASGDRRLLAAWSAEGVAVSDVGQGIRANDP